MLPNLVLLIDTLEQHELRKVSPAVSQRRGPARSWQSWSLGRILPHLHRWNTPKFGVTVGILTHDLNLGRGDAHHCRHNRLPVVFPDDSLASPQFLSCLIIHNVLPYTMRSSLAYYHTISSISLFVVDFVHQNTHDEITGAKPGVRTPHGSNPSRPLESMMRYT